MARSDKRATMRDVAEHANVSVGTVSRVINNSQTVQPATRESVLAAMQRLDYEPNVVAQSMRTRVTRSIGCVVPTINIPYYSQSVVAAEEVLYDQGYTLMLTNSFERVRREVELLTFHRRRQVDGVIAAISSDSDEQVLRSIGDLGVPLVLLQREFRIPVDAVGVDYYAGVASAIGHLAEFGHRRIAIIVGRTGIPIEERMETLREIHRDAGLGFDANLVHFCDISQELPFIRMRDLMSTADCPTAVVAGSTQIAAVLRALKSMNVSIPDGVSVISLGENDLTTLYDPPITSIRWDNAEVGRTAAHLLIQRITGSGLGGPVSYVVPGDLVLRASTAPVSSSVAAG